MEPNEYLQTVLDQQTLDPNGEEVEAMDNHRQDVEDIIVDEFAECTPTIEYGGSRAKKTMVKCNYDIDVICYFPNDADDAGDNLKEIYNNVYTILSEHYRVEKRTSALRLRSKDPESLGEDFHIDVVAGRYTDETKTDVFLHVNNGDKKRLKTNLQKHISFIKGSQLTETIRLAKIWNFEKELYVKTFVLELLVIKALAGKTDANGYADNLQTLWTYLKHNRDSLCVEDPANPTGNDLSDAIDSIRTKLCDSAVDALALVDQGKWESLFGPVESEDRASKVAALNQAVQIQYAGGAPRPWLSEHSI